MKGFDMLEIETLRNDNWNEQLLLIKETLREWRTTTDAEYEIDLIVGVSKTGSRFVRAIERSTQEHISYIVMESKPIYGKIPLLSINSMLNKSQLLTKLDNIIDFLYIRRKERE
jgi:hypothetical protein